MAITQTRGDEAQASLEIQEQTLIEQVLPSMALAPSAHNTQPWRFAVSNNQIDVFVNWKRHLHVSDKINRQLYVGIGCTIENGVIAANYRGYEVKVEYFPEGMDKNNPAARILVITGGYKQENEKLLFQAIEDRRTNRLLYDKQPLKADEKEALAKVKEPEMLFIEDREQISRIADLTAEGIFHTMAQQDFKEELSRWVRNNWTKKPDGMPGYAVGVPGPLSFFGRIMVRLAPIHKDEAPKSKEQMNSASGVVVFVTTEDTPIDWMKTGQRLERVWLQATAAGLAAAPLVASVESSEELREKLKKVLGTDLLPQSVIRIGHSDQKVIRALPRRTVVDCLRTV